MVAIKSFAALFAVATVAVASFEPLEERSTSTVPQFEVLDARDTFPSHVQRSSSQAIPRAHAALSKRGINDFYATRVSSYVGDLASSITSIKSEIHTACKGAKKTPTGEFTKTITKHLNKCKEHVHKTCGHVHKIPHLPHGSTTPHKPPTLPGCAGQLSAVILDVTDIFDEVKETVKGNKQLEDLVKSYIAGMDEELGDLVGSSESLLSGIAGLTQKYTYGIQNSLVSNGFANLLAKFVHFRQ